MWIERDISEQLIRDKSYIQILLGPRQCGKSSLFTFLGQDEFQEITFDDLQMRTLANNDPALFLEQHKPPLNIDEAQYAPNIFPELKKTVDKIKKERLFSAKKVASETMFRLTGSNQVFLDKNVKESLVGRASYYHLNTLSVHEIISAFPDIAISEIMFKGGWPELYVNDELNVTQYLNNYVRSYIEKDIVLSAGIEKQAEFHTILGMLAARTGELVNYSSIANHSGVKSVTVKEWVSILERTNLVYLLKPYASNLNKRLVKAPKLYFLDTGLAARLQGWNEESPLLKSPSAGHIFETLALAEIIKYKQNFSKDWNIYFWRTKEGDEVDFVIQKANGETLALDAKMGMHSISPKKLSNAFTKDFPQTKQMVIVSYGGKRLQLSSNCVQIPITELTQFLSEF